MTPVSLSLKQRLEQRPLAARVGAILPFSFVRRRAERDAMLARRSAATADSDVDEKDDDAGPSPRAPVGNAGGPSGASASHRAAEQPRPRRAPGLLRPALKAAGAVRQGTASGAHGEGGADAGAQPRQSKRVRFVDTGEEKPSPKRRMVEGGPARSLPPRSVC